MFKIRTLLVFSLYLISSSIIACSCISSTLEEKIARTDNIFVVETYQIETLEKAQEDKLSAGKRRGHFVVLETLKGTSYGAKFIKSSDAPICCLCQAKVTDKTSYLVFSNDNNHINLSACGYTRAVGNILESVEAVKTAMQSLRPKEIYSGIFIPDQQLFYSDDGWWSEILSFKRENYTAKMTHISFKGMMLKSNRLLVTTLVEQQSLTQQKINELTKTVDEYIKLSNEKDTRGHQF